MSRYGILCLGGKHVDSNIIQYLKDGGLLAAFALFLHFSWKSQVSFLECLLKFQQTIDTIVNRCDKGEK